MKTVNPIFPVLIFVLSFPLNAQDEPSKAEFSGQGIGWSNLNFQKPVSNQWGLRYIPSFSGGIPLSAQWRLDAEASLNAWAVTTVESGKWESSAKIKPYRLWLRLSTGQFEFRTGLQKINFGSAVMLRPLMWFDRIDPRDPLQLTDGVYAALARYYFLNNANIWLWFLYGNDETKGWEFLPTSEKKPEFGGRIQFPVYTGETGISFHHRQVGPDSVYNAFFTAGYPMLNEDRLGLDGKWDIGPGVWFEEVLKHRQPFESLPVWENYLTLGLDYTFGIGNGLTTTIENFTISTSGRAYNRKANADFSALNLTYPIGMIDMFSAILYYDWINKSFYRFLNWQRTYDRWSFYLMAFWNPENIAIYRNTEGNNLFAGKGMQIMIVFNH